MLRQGWQLSGNTSTYQLPQAAGETRPVVFLGVASRVVGYLGCNCISADGRCLQPLIIWPAATHRTTWTTHPPPGWREHLFASRLSGVDMKGDLAEVIDVFKA